MKKDRKITVRVTEEEYARVCSYADSVGMRVSEYVRSRSLKESDRVFYDADMTEALRGVREELRIIGVEISEIASRVNDGDESAEDALRMVENHLQHVYQTVRAYENQLKMIKGVMMDGNYKAAAD